MKNDYLIDLNTKLFTYGKDLTITNDDERTFLCTMSSEISDRENEVVLSDGVDTSQFEKSAPVLFNHDSNKPVGKVVGFQRGPGFLRAKVQLMQRPDDYVGDFPADLVWQCVKQQPEATGVSIGFIRKEARKPTKKDMETFGKEVEIVTSKALLVELSVTPIPANQNALIESVSTKAMDGANESTGEDGGMAIGDAENEHPEGCKCMKCYDEKAHVEGCKCEKCMKDWTDDENEQSNPMEENTEDNDDKNIKESNKKMIINKIIEIEVYEKKEDPNIILKREIVRELKIQKGLMY